MEFVQFHPTGMVWPPSVKGILVTESVRGDGGVLRNSEGTRFMFNYVPEVFRAKYAETEEEADGWYKDSEKNRRPPDLLPRDEVARAINSEVKAGRGTEHGGVFLDVSTRLPAEEIKRRLPSMHHQFSELADVDITKVPMEVGPTCHYVMGGVEVDPDTAAAARVPGLFAAGEVSGGMHGSNRLGGNSLSDLLVFGRRAGIGAADYVAALAGRIPQVRAGYDRGRRRAGCRAVPPPATAGENPYTLHRELQQLMNDLVGIIRKEAEIQQALDAIDALKPSVAAVSVEGHRQFNPGWHLALDLVNMLHGQRMRRAGRADPAGKPRRAHPRRLPGDERAVAAQTADLRDRGRRHRGHRAADPTHPAGSARPVRAVRAGEVPDRRRACRLRRHRRTPSRHRIRRSTMSEANHGHRHDINPRGTSGVMS